VRVSKLQQIEFALLSAKMKRHELSRLDVQRILALEWRLNGTWDELDNYDQYLAPGAKPVLHEKLLFARSTNRTGDGANMRILRR